MYKRQTYAFIDVTKDHTTPKGQVPPVAPEEIVCINQRRDLHDRIDKLRLKETSALEPAYEKGLD